MNFNSVTDKSCLDLILFINKGRNLNFRAADNSEV